MFPCCLNHMSRIRCQTVLNDLERVPVEEDKVPLDRLLRQYIVRLELMSLIRRVL